jgi:two-component system LytT family response regulator
MEEKLNPGHFLRIQRSVIVNIERIKKLYPLFRGEYEFVLEDGTRLISSRAY